VNIPKKKKTPKTICAIPNFQGIKFAKGNSLLEKYAANRALFAGLIISIPIVIKMKVKTHRRSVGDNIE
jgi:hypothetical protein